MSEVSAAPRSVRVPLALHIVAALALVLISSSQVLAATVTAMWDANTESNISGYVLSYGTSSGTYTSSIEVGNVTSYQLSLNPGRYYFAVRARNTNGQLSAYSTQVVHDVANPTGPALFSLSPSSGAIGSSVTIAGANFGSTQGTSTVRFNGATATVLSWTASAIVASVPSGATSGNVVVTVGGVASNGLSFSVTTAPASLPSSWTSQNIGSPALTGTASYASGVFTVSGAGDDIWNNADQFNFVYRTMTGDGEVVARVDTLQNTDVYAKAGVMIRQDLTAGAANAMARVTQTSGNMAFQRRLSAGQMTTSITGFTGLPPEWVKLVRSGNTITGYYSATGTSWTLLGSDTFSMPATVYVGLAVTSHNASVLNTATISNVTVTTGSAPSGPSITSLSPTSGPVGTSVTISGANFGSTQGTSTVRFNGTTATPTSWSASSIVAAVPSAATTGSVVVTVNGVASNGSTYTVTTVAPPPAPTLTSLSPTSGAVGTSVTISGSNFGSTQGTSTVRFNGTTATATSWSGSTIVASVPSGATSGNVVVTVGGVASNGLSFSVTTAPASLPAPWTSQNIGSPALTGTASYASGVFTVSGAGDDIWNNADQFNFVYRTMTGDGEVVARVDTLQNTDVYAKAGVMIRQDLTAGAANAMARVAQTSGNMAFQRRLSAGQMTTSITGFTGLPPQWVKLVRSGSTITGYYSTNGTTWNLLGSDTFSMPATVYVGLAVTSHNASALNTATLSNVSVTSGSTPTSLPSPWTSQNIGSPSINGTATYASGVFTVTGAGNDIWETSDQFNFVYQPLNGNGEIVARVDSIVNTDEWAKAGVMVREDLTAGARNVMALVAGSAGVSVQWRATAGGVSDYSSLSGSAPRWIRLVRSGDTFTGYHSSTGTSWTQIGTTTVAMATQVYIGLAVTSHNASQLTTSAISNVSVTTGTSTPPPSTPSVITMKQDDVVDAGTVTSRALGFGSSVASGSLIAVVIRSGQANQTFAITDTRGHTYRQAVRRSGSDHTVGIYYAENATGGTTTVTVAQGSSSTLRFVILEFTGVAATNALDVAGSSSGSGTSPSASATTTTAGDLLLGGIASSSTATYTAGSGYTIAEVVPAAPGSRLLAEWRVQSEAGSTSARATLSTSTAWAAGIAAFKAAPIASSMSLTSLDSGAVALESASLSSDGDGADQAGDARSLDAPVRSQPPSSDYDGDGRSDATTYRPSTGQWRVLTAASNYTTGFVRSWGAATDVRVPGDYDGDGTTDLAYYRPSNGSWQILTSASGFTQMLDVVIGGGLETPVPADYDGDGATDVAVYDSKTGQWHVLSSSAGFGAEVLRNWGSGSDVPVPGDYDGDGKADPAVYSPAAGEWKIVQSGTDYAGNVSIRLGGGADVAVPADYDGDGITDAAVFRPSTGEWRIMRSTDRSTAIVQGAASGSPVALDFDGDGRADPTVFENGIWRVVLSSMDYKAGMTIDAQGTGDLPLPTLP